MRFVTGLKASCLGVALLCVTVCARPASADNENLLLGNPSSANATDANNLLVEHPEFSLSYNKSNGGPNWVSWHLDSDDRGRNGRSNNFRPDPLLPPDSQIRPTDYRGSGYDRGHMCPSADRTATAESNSATFLMSNMLPQTGDLNRQVWRKFEEYCRSQLRGGANEIYLLSGGVGSIKRIANDKVNVPGSCWKIAVFLPVGSDDLSRITAETRVVSILIPNETGPEIAEADWRQYLTSVDKIEELTGYDFLSAVSPTIQKELEARIDGGRAPATREGANAEPQPEPETEN
jgi:endonuclease G, mitochondrial